MNITSNKDLKDFAILLISELEMKNDLAYVDELKTWNASVFTSSSEYLGFFLDILEKLQYSSKLSEETKGDVNYCIQGIKKGFEIANRSLFARDNMIIK